MAAIKEKLVECVARNIAKEKCSDSNKSYQFYVEAELILKQLLLDVLIEKANGDPQEYTEYLENVQEIMELDYYDTLFLESLIFGN